MMIQQLKRQFKRNAKLSALHCAGSILEGGGQILRNAAALSAILQAPICVEKIRAG
jgi:RNA 3'-terminal phosphate cyclase (ATP)